MTEAKKKVLLVDDEEDIRKFLCFVLKDEGYDLVTAKDGEEGLQKARQEKPDVAVLDVQMPKKDGFQLFHELRGDPATKDIKVIMLTAVTARTGIGFDKKAMGDFLGNEPDVFIDKPIPPEVLKKTVRKLVGG